MKYVALLAYNKIVKSHPHVVASQEDTILSCIDDPDFSIRLEALKLLSRLISAHNIVELVDRLMRQLGSRGLATRSASLSQIVPAGTEEVEIETAELVGSAAAHIADPLMPDDYRATVVRQILKMCSQDSYANITDFQWYLRVLIELYQDVPLESLTLASYDTTRLVHSDESIATLVGSELRNIAVRVTNVRSDVVRASSTALATRATRPTLSQTGGQEVLEYIIWVVGEYAELLPSITDTLNALLPLCMIEESLTCVTLQSAAKLVVAHITSATTVWDVQQRVSISLLLTKLVQFSEYFVTSPNIEVQERASELLEIFRLAEEAIKSHLPTQESPPLLLTHAIPSLFNSVSLNPVAPSAQRKVPIPKRLNLDGPINHGLNRLITYAEHEPLVTNDLSELGRYYQETSRTEAMAEPAGDTLDNDTMTSNHLQGRGFDLAGDTLSKGQEEVHERHQDDPYYISSANDLGTNAPAYFHDMITNDREQDMDIDAIPIMDLDLGPLTIAPNEEKVTGQKQRQVLHITADEEIETEDDNLDSWPSAHAPKKQTIAGNPRYKVKRPLLQVDSSGIGGLDSESETPVPGVANVSYNYDVENEAMTKALAEVEQARLEMQRAAERVRATGDIPDGGMLVKKRAKRKTAKNMSQGPRGSDTNIPVTRKKKKTRLTVPELESDNTNHS